jgi:hypothetical protein
MNRTGAHVENFSQYRNLIFFENPAEFSSNQEIKFPSKRDANALLTALPTLTRLTRVLENSD